MQDVDKRQMTGTVLDQQGQYFVVFCPDAPSHLKYLNLVAWQMGKSKVGDRVRLEYVTGPSYGLWNVVEVL